MPEPRRDDPDPQFTDAPPRSDEPPSPLWSRPITPDLFIKKPTSRSWVGGLVVLGILAGLVGFAVWQHQADQDRERRQAEQRAQHGQAEAEFRRGLGLLNAGDPAGAEAAFRAAVRLNPASAPAHNGLGLALQRQQQLDDAAAEFREAVRLQPDFAWAHDNLGNTLRLQGRLDEAVASLREAVRLAPNESAHHFNLGVALHVQGRWADAESAYRDALALSPDQAGAANNLGLVLRAQGKMDESDDALRKAVKLQPGSAPSLSDLGINLHVRGRLTEAVELYTESLKLNDDEPIAHLNLGEALGRLGKFREALAHLRRGHQLGSARPDWDLPSGQWLRVAERIVALEGRLDEYLRGGWTPETPDDQLALAEVCVARERHADAAVLFEQALAARPALAGEDGGGYALDAACALVQAGLGQGEGVAGLGDEERAELRRRALERLSADLADKVRKADADPGKELARAQWRLLCWKNKTELGGVRDYEALARLPQSERGGWRKLWADVEQVMRRPQKR
jgi:tetratricopeptide (TPR) repeat protein